MRYSKRQHAHAYSAGIRLHVASRIRAAADGEQDKCRGIRFRKVRREPGMHPFLFAGLKEV